MTLILPRRVRGRAEEVHGLREDGRGIEDEGKAVDFEEPDLGGAAQEVERGSEMLFEKRDDFRGDVGRVAGGAEAHAVLGKGDLFGRAAHEDRIERKKADLKEIEAKLNAPKLYTQDVTSQTLGPLLQAQPGEGLASLSADARELADIWLGKYTDGKGTDENFYVQAWTGDPYESDRTTRGKVSEVL